MVRPIRAETERYGEYSKPGEFVYDHPFQWGSRRIGPDLHRVGGKYPHLWHVRHMEDPRSTTPQSIMPPYAWLLEGRPRFRVIQRRVDVMAMLGVPYGDAVNHAEQLAREQAKQIAAEIQMQGGPAGLEGKKIVALIAYLQRLGTDIKKPGTGEGGGVSAQAAAPGSAPPPGAPLVSPTLGGGLGMKLGDLMSAMSFSSYAEVALLDLLRRVRLLVTMRSFEAQRPTRVRARAAACRSTTTIRSTGSRASSADRRNSDMTEDAKENREPRRDSQTLRRRDADGSRVRRDPGVRQSRCPAGGSGSSGARSSSPSATSCTIHLAARARA